MLLPSSQSACVRLRLAIPVGVLGRALLCYCVVKETSLPVVLFLLRSLLVGWDLKGNRCICLVRLLGMVRHCSLSVSEDRVVRGLVIKIVVKCECGWSECLSNPSSSDESGGTSNLTPDFGNCTKIWHFLVLHAFITWSLLTLWAYAHIFSFTSTFIFNSVGVRVFDSKTGVMSWTYHSTPLLPGRRYLSVCLMLLRFYICANWTFLLRTYINMFKYSVS